MPEAKLGELGCTKARGECTAGAKPRTRAYQDRRREADCDLAAPVHIWQTPLVNCKSLQFRTHIPEVQVPTSYEVLFSGASGISAALT